MRFFSKITLLNGPVSCDEWVSGTYLAGHDIDILGGIGVLEGLEGLGTWEVRPHRRLLVVVRVLETQEA